MIKITIAIILICIIVKTIKAEINNQKSKRIQIKRGKDGEKNVASILANLDRRKYTVINDVMLKINESTTQIDHIVVSVYGVFVIETKNFTGCIYGRSDKYKWQRYSYNGNKLLSEFYSPIRQNMTHIEMIHSLLDIERYKLKPIVCFVGATKLKFIGDEIVINDYELLRYIECNNEILLSKKEAAKVIEKLSEYTEYTEEDKNEHIKRIEEKRKNKSYGKCPLCGGKLVIRSSKTREFIGCSNFPKCRYTTQLYGS